MAEPAPEMPLSRDRDSSRGLPPHPATVAQPKRPFSVLPPRPPHPATVVQRSTIQKMDPPPGKRYARDPPEERRPKKDVFELAKEARKKSKEERTQREKLEQQAAARREQLLGQVIDKCEDVTRTALNCVVRLMKGDQDDEATSTRRALSLTLFGVHDPLSDFEYALLFSLCRILQRMLAFLERDRAQLLVQIVPFSPQDWRVGSALHGRTRWLLADSIFASIPAWDARARLATYAAVVEDRHPLSAFQRVIDVKGAPFHPNATIELPLVDVVEGDPVAFHTTTLLHEVAHAAAELDDPLPVVGNDDFRVHHVFARYPGLTLRNAESVALFIRTLVRLLAGNEP
jgi:hypothetical protein